MKLRNLAIFAIALSLPLAACGGDDDDAVEDGVVVDTPAVVAPAPLPPPPAPMPADTMAHDTMGGMSHDSMADTTKM